MTILYAVLAMLALLAVVMAINTGFKKPSKQTTAKPPPDITLDADAISRRLSGMIRYKTVTSATMEGVDTDAFLGFHQYLEDTYPLLHKTLDKEAVNTYSLLYKWTGSGSDKKPFLMMAHMDVVPVDARTADKWEYDAYSGMIADGYVWGRGSIDMKGQLCAVMECIEHLIAQGFKPARDIYIALGHDEETLGVHGAQAIVERLKQKDVSLDFVIDEGGVVMDGKMLGVNAMVAAIGICEKGYADIRLTVDSKGGHASRPPKATAVGTLTCAIAALEKHQMKPSLNTPLKMMLDAVGGYMKFPLNVVAANLFITKPLLLGGFTASSTGAAMARTTTAPTMLAGSTAPNVLAERAEAVVNFRISPDDSVARLIGHIKKVIRNDDVKIEVIQAYEPSAVSRIDSEAYDIIAQTVGELFSGYVVTPYLMIAATDSRRYAEVADGIYRFQPFRSVSEELDTIHAVGERLGIDSLKEAVWFFMRLVKNADG